MQDLIPYLPWLIAMFVLLGVSAFFSASEAALFILSRQDRRALASGNSAQQIAVGLLEHPDRLLTAVLFWNLLVNISFFAVTSLVGLNLSRDPAHGDAAAVGFSVGSLLAIIFFSEMLPKSLAVLRPRSVAAFVAVPVSAAVRAIDPLMPAARLVQTLSRRVLWPDFQQEPYLEVDDLQRAVELSTTDAALRIREQTVLTNILSLSDIRAEELMRPRSQFLTFAPPVHLRTLEGKVPPSGYVLITEPDSDEVTAAIPLRHMPDIPSDHLEHYAEAVWYVPWCSSVGSAMEEMRQRGRRVAAVINEFGETIGILTLDELLETVFTDNPSRSRRMLNRWPIAPAGEGVWHVNGITSLRRLAQYFQVSIPTSKSVTVAGIVHEALERLPHSGDRCSWGPFQMHVIDAEDPGQLLIELRLKDKSRGAAP